MSEEDDRREEPRTDTHAAVFVEVDSPEPGQGEVPLIVLCQILDVSVSGMRIRLDREVPEGAILTLRAEFGRTRPPLRVVGEVRWIRETPEAYEAGFNLYESDYTDIEKWKSLVERQL